MRLQILTRVVKVVKGIFSVLSEITDPTSSGNTHLLC